MSTKFKLKQLEEVEKSEGSGTDQGSYDSASDGEATEIELEEGDETTDIETKLAEDDKTSTTQKTKAATTAELSKKSLEKLKQKIEDSCVIYMSRIPPRMKPNKLKKILQDQYKLKVGRVFFSEEDPQLRLKRKLNGGSRRKHFTEGWIELFDKTKAKSWAKSANNNKIENKTHSYFNEDLWNIKYLPKFKWNNLTERIAYETQARSQKLQNEISQAKKFNQSFIDKVELNKKVQGMELKKKLKSDTPTEGQDKVKVLRSFRQREVQVKDLTTKQQLESKSVDLVKSKNAKREGRKDEGEVKRQKKLDSVLSNLFG